MDRTAKPGHPRDAISRNGGSLMIRTTLLGLGIVTGGLGSVAFSQDDIEFGDWAIVVNKDLMDDTTKTTAFLRSDHPEVVLVLRCIGEEIAVLIGGNNYLGSGPDHEIQVRVPPARAVTQTWSMFPNGKMVFSKDPMDIINALIGATHSESEGKFVVRTRAEDWIVTATFDVELLDLLRAFRHFPCIAAQRDQF